MTTIILTRKQCKQLGRMGSDFKKTELFDVSSLDHTGIGPTVMVTFTLVDEHGEHPDTTVDITDFKSW